jgi:hypothetical protein
MQPIQRILNTLKHGSFIKMNREIMIFFRYPAASSKQLPFLLPPEDLLIPVN